VSVENAQPLMTADVARWPSSVIPTLKKAILTEKFLFLWGRSPKPKTARRGRRATTSDWL
jgi:hypothetical protein